MVVRSAVMNLGGIACGVNMAHKILVVALLLSTVAISLQEDAQTDYDYEDGYYDEQAPINDSKETQEIEDIASETENNSKEAQIRDPKIIKVKRDREELTTEKQVSKYEVTELVIDIPDTSMRRVPIISNFSLTRPLNFAGTPNNKTYNVEANVKDEGDEIINSILIPNTLRISKNNQGQNEKGINFKFDASKDDNDYLSDSNPKDSFEEEFDKEFKSDEDYFDDFEDKKEPKPSKSFKDHFHSFRKSIVSEFKSVVDKHKDGIHDSLRKIVNGPILFFDKLHRKSSDLAKKLHKAVSRHKFHDHEDDTGYHDVDHDDEED